MPVSTSANLKLMLGPTECRKAYLGSIVVHDTAGAVPAQMAAPAVSSTGQTSISVDRAAAPADNGSPITSYDLRVSTDETNWTTFTDVSDPQGVGSLSQGTLYYAQTRAVNAIGAGPWSPSGSATTDAAAPGGPYAFTPENSVSGTYGDTATSNIVLTPNAVGDQLFVMSSERQGFTDGDHVCTDDNGQTWEKIAGHTNDHSSGTRHSVSVWMRPAVAADLTGVTVTAGPTAANRRNMGWAISSDKPFDHVVGGVSFLHSGSSTSVADVSSGDVVSTLPHVFVMQFAAGRNGAAYTPTAGQLTPARDNTVIAGGEENQMVMMASFDNASEAGGSVQATYDPPSTDEECTAGVIIFHPVLSYPNPVVAATYATDGTVGTEDWTFPIALEPGDRVDVILSSDSGPLSADGDGTGSALGLPASSGYDVIHAHSGGNPGFLVARKIMGATPDTAITVEKSTTVRMRGNVYVTRNADPVSLTDNGVSVNPVGTVPDAPEHTTVTDYTLRVIAGAMDDESSNDMNPPAGWSNPLTNRGNSISVGSAVKIAAFAGAEDPAAFDAGGATDEVIAVHYAIRPAS